jgi:hypothetical protein
MSLNRVDDRQREIHDEHDAVLCGEPEHSHIEHDYGSIEDEEARRDKVGVASILSHCSLRRLTKD